MLTRIHLGRDMSEIGVQFEADDGAGGTVKQRAFLTLPDGAATATLWAAVESALAAKLAELPIDLPPGAVTTALMQQRTARAAAKKAGEQRLAAEKAKDVADAARERAEEARLSAEAAKSVAEADAAALALQIAEARATKAALEAEIAAAEEARATAEESTPIEAEPSPK